MRKLNLTLNIASIFLAGASLAFFVTNNVGDAVYFLVGSIWAKSGYLQDI